MSNEQRQPLARDNRNRKSIDQVSIGIDMVHISLGGLEVTGELNDDWQRLLHVIAPLRLVVGDDVIIDEPSFPVVELSSELKRWQRREGGFDYQSMESEVAPLLLIATGDCYYIASPLSGRCATDKVTKKALFDALDRFIAEVECALLKRGLTKPGK